MVKLNSLLSDAKLVRRVLSSDGSPAFEVLVHRYQKKAFAVAHAVGVKEGEREDLVQDAFLQALRSLRSLRDFGAFGPWFLAIVRNLSRKRLLSYPREAWAILTPDTPSATLSESSSEDLHDIRAELQRALASLSETLRETVLLYYYEGKSSREVARALGVSHSAVRSRLKRARDELRDRLWREFEAKIKEQFPSTREWRRRAGRLSLLAAATSGIFASGCAAKARNLGLSEALILRVISVGGGFLSKKLGFSIVIAVALCSLLLLFIELNDREEDRLASSPEVVVQPASEQQPPPVSEEPKPAKVVAITEVSEPERNEVQTIHHAIRGQVVSLDGSGVPFTRLLLRCKGCPAKEWTPDSELEVYSEDDGSFVFENLTAGHYELEARPGRHQRERVNVAVPCKNDVVIEVEQSPFVRVRCLLARNGAPLTLTDVNFGALVLPRRTRSHWGRALTDSEGVIAITLAPGSHELTLWREGLFSTAQKVELPEDGPSPELTVHFEEGVVVQGLVMSEQGSLLSNAQLRWQAKRTHLYSSRLCVSDADGRYRISGLEPGEYWVRLDEHATPALRGKLVAVESIAVQEKSLILDVPGDQEIVLLDASGSPIEDYPLFFKAATATKGFSRHATAVSTSTDKDGRCYLQRIGVHSKLEVDINEPELGWLQASFRVTDPPTPLTLQFEKWAQVEGQVLSRGRVTGSSVQIRAISLSTPRVVDTDVGEDGSFSLQLRPGPYRLEALAEDRIRGYVQTLHVTVGEVTDVEVLLEDLVTMRITVLEQGGGPVQGVQVKLRAETDRLLSYVAESDENGIAIIDGLRAEYSIDSAEGSEQYDLVQPVPLLSSRNSEAVLVVVPQEEPGSVKISGIVRHDGALVEGALVRVVRHKETGGYASPSASSAFVTTDKRGRFVFERARAGKLWVVAQGPGFAFAHSRLLGVSPNDVLENVEVDSLRGKDLGVTVVDGKGVGLVKEQVVLTAVDAGAPRGAWGWTDDWGHCTFGWLPPGRYQVSTKSMDGRSEEQTVELSWPSEDGDVVLTLR